MFRHHSTIHRVHRLTDAIAATLERKQFHTGLLLDIAQTFDRVWPDGLLYESKLMQASPIILNSQIIFR